MKRKLIIYGLLIISIMIPLNTFALDNSVFEILSEESKYYKTTVIQQSSNINSILLTPISYTEEISKEEFDSYENNDINTNSTAFVESTYKKLTTTLSSNGSKYRYTVTLDWKNFPKVRSYDTIAIGHYASVRVSGGLHFSQSYCISGGDCRTIQTYYPYTSDTGSAATFKVPKGTMTSLSQSLYFDVVKNTASTVISQRASGDYAHAIETVSVSKAMDYKVTNSGITYSASSYKSFDEISVAEAIWNGTW